MQSGFIRPGFHMCLKCLRHVPDTIELNGASTVWDMSQACHVSGTYVFNLPCTSGLHVLGKFDL